MTAEPRTDTPRVVHRLAVALRFVDAFTGTSVRAPLAVSISALGWSALGVESDSTYRFLVTNAAAVPAGTFDVAVTAPGGEYVNWESIQVQLPRPSPPHPPPFNGNDFLVSLPLWPTPLVRTPPGETAVVGRVVSTSAAAVAGLRVIIFLEPGPAPAAPYTRTDPAGAFLFRLPLLRGSVSGSTVVSTASVGVALRDTLDNPLAVVPAGPIDLPLGRTSMLTFTIP
jgi:hypothetical protein